jgi:hypothetical protein
VNNFLINNLRGINMHDENMELIKKLSENQKKLQEARELDEYDLHIDTYGNARYYSDYEASEVIVSMIKSGKPFFIGRIGETELRTVSCYDRKWHNINIRNLRALRDANYCICVNAGFFPKNILKIKKFCDIEKETFSNMDAFGMYLWDNEEYYVQKYMKLDACFLANSFILAPLYIGNSWTRALKGKRVLVVHPFAESISSQFSKRDKLFKDKSILPEFELIIIKAVQSIGGEGAWGYKTWFEALDDMKLQISKYDYDIALLGCGAYGLPLASYIKNMGKQAIYVGGALQLLFGIVGKRWEDLECVKKNINEYWVRPSEHEKPKGNSKVEDGCYW